jgi:hypothetical protein
MNKYIIAGLAVVLAMVLLLFYAGRDLLNDNDNDENRERQAVENTIDRLPYSTTLGGRVIAFDGDSLDESSRDQYSQRDATTLPQNNDDPVDYIENILRFRLTQDEIMQEPDLYNNQVAFYEYEDNGVTAYVRVSNIPDDSVGAVEERFDLVYEDNNWKLDWYGVRQFCRRPDQEFWAPLDQPCP